MRRRLAAFSLLDLIAIILMGVLVAFWLIAMRREIDGHPPICANQLCQIGKAQQAYMNTNNDFWAFQQDERPGLGTRTMNHLGKAGDGNHNPCVSLAVLYPRWIDDIAVFRCPRTEDRPIIVNEELDGYLYAWFGKMDSLEVGNGNPDGTLTGRYPTLADQRHVVPYQRYHSDNGEQTGEEGQPGRFADYATPVEHERVGLANASYGYDDMAHYRDMQPGSARAADMRYEVSNGERDTWIEQANHADDGQNVLYWDGHVAFFDSVYASADPQDNIYIVNTDGGSGDAVVARTHCDPLKPDADLVRKRDWAPWP